MLWRALGWPIVAALITLLLTPLLEPLDRRAFDARLGIRRDGGWPAEIVMVAIDDATLRVQGRWPWPRGRLASLLDAIRAHGARTVLFDAVPIGSTEPGEDARLAEALDRTVLGVAYAHDAGEGTVPDLERAMVSAASFGPVYRPDRLSPSDRAFASRAAALGHVLYLVGRDGYVRSHVPLVGVDGLPGSLPSQALVALTRYRGIDAATIASREDAIAIAGLPPLRTYGGEAYLDLVPGGSGPPRVSAADLLRGTIDPRARAALDDRLAILYVDSALQPNRFPTPLSPTTPGGLIAAYAIRSMATGRAPRPVSRRATLGALLAVAAALSNRGVRRGPAFALATAAIGAVGTAAISVALVPLSDLFAPVAAPVAFWILWGAIVAADAGRALERDRRSLRALLDAAPPPGSTPSADDSAEDATTVPVPRTVEASSAGPELKNLGLGDAVSVPVDIGNYRVESLIARGGMGAVFAATDRRLGRSVALKVLERQEPDAFRRFRREAILVARINHPNVVQIHEVGLDAAVPYLVMELVAGGTASDLVRTGPLPWERATRIISQAARGLGAAHHHGIVHRDVKPGNILRADADEDRVKVVDFGIAKLSGDEGITKKGTFFGTIGYLSPEQARGEEVGPTSDVYSLGLTWYWLLTARSAFRGATAQRFLANVRLPVPDPRELVPAIPIDVSERLRQMTDTDPSKRPPDGTAMATELDALLTSLL